MIPRNISTELKTQLKEYPIVTLLGPRQSGKTTLVKAELPDYQYINLENPEIREIATEDPKAFLKRYTGKVIFDEIQRTPHLLSYLQVIVDEHNSTGQFVLTGSHQLELRAAITQSLSGRTGILQLLPLSIAELENIGMGFNTPEDYIFNGFLPRTYDQKQRPHIAYANYYQTYIERDVQQLIRLKEASLFEKFMKLLAGRVGQIINYQSLSNDIGVDSKTIKQWLSILEASFIIFKLPPYFKNFGKRTIKSPKYYFFDTGILCYLLSIEKPEQVTRDPLLGSIFENLVVLEALKSRFNKGLPSNLYFFRDSYGLEIDLLYQSGNEMTGIAIKAASTWHQKFKKNLSRFSQKHHPLEHSYVAYSGDPIAFSDGVKALRYNQVAHII